MSRELPRARRVIHAALFSALVLLLVQPHPRDEETPLPADMASHTLGAVEFVDAVASRDLGAVKRTLLARDLYPPGHSIVLGTWMLLFGESPGSLWGFRWFLLALALLAVLSLGTAAGSTSTVGLTTAAGVWLASPFLLGLSTSVLVEPLALALLLWALVAIDSLDRRPTPWAGLGASALVTALLLTKYNLALPLLPTLGLLAAWRFRQGRRNRARGLALTALFAGAGWALFLSLQNHGWESFLAFARNRSNSEGTGALERLDFYWDSYLNRGLPAPEVGILMLLATGGHWLRARARVFPIVTCVLYIVLTLLALSRHPYLLSRNLSGVLAVGGILAALGAARIVDSDCLSSPRPRRGRWCRGSVRGALAAAAVGLALLSLPRARTEFRRWDPPELEQLTPLSKALQAELERYDELLVSGTFNEFSHAWVRLLHRKTEKPARLWGELAPPIEPARNRIPSGDHDAYDRALRQWCEDHPSAAIFHIQVSDASPWCTEDYRRWCGWKRNWLRAAQRLDPAYSHSRSLELLGGGVSVLCQAHHDGALRFGEGWGPREEWGRWALAHETTIRVAPSPQPRVLILEAAPFEAMRGEEQRCRVLREAAPPVEWVVRGRAWEWSRLAIELPPGFAGELRLQFDRLWETGSGSTLRALPFREISFEGGDHPGPSTEELP